MLNLMLNFSIDWEASMGSHLFGSHLNNSLKARSTLWKNSLIPNPALRVPHPHWPLVSASVQEPFPEITIKRTFCPVEKAESSPGLWSRERPSPNCAPTLISNGRIVKTITDHPRSISKRRNHFFLKMLKAVCQV